MVQEYSRKLFIFNGVQATSVGYAPVFSVDQSTLLANCQHDDWWTLVPYRSGEVAAFVVLREAHGLKYDAKWERTEFWQTHRKPDANGITLYWEFTMSPATLQQIGDPNKQVVIRVYNR